MEYIEQHRADLPSDVYETALTYADEYGGWRRGKSPKVTAAMATYVGWNTKHSDPPTQRDIADMYGVTTNALRMQYRDSL